MIGLPYPGAAALRHRDGHRPPLGAPHRGGGVDVRLWADGLRPAPYRPRPGQSDLRHPPPVPELHGVAGAPRGQRHRRRRQHHQTSRRVGAHRVRRGRRIRGPLVGVDGRPGGSAPAQHPARHAVHRGHGGAGGRPGGQGDGIRDAGRRLPGGLQGGRVRPTRTAVARIAAGGGPGRGQRGQAVPAGFRAVEEGEGGGAKLGVAVGTGPARVAHRVRGDVARPARRGVRPARRRAGPEVPAPRERAGPGGRRRQGLRPALDAHGWVEVEGTKMSKSLGNFTTLPDLLSRQRRPRLPAPGGACALSLAHRGDARDVGRRREGARQVGRAGTALRCRRTPGADARGVRRRGNAARSGHRPGRVG